MIEKLISSAHSLKTLKFWNEKFTEIKVEILELIWLLTLSFAKMEQLKKISAKIKAFDHLEHFGLWGTSTDYFSHVLFNL